MKDESPRKQMPSKKPPAQLPKLCGADMELGNFVQGVPGRYETYTEAARALLREIEGQPCGAISYSYSRYDYASSPADPPLADSSLDQGSNHSHSGYRGEGWVYQGDGGHSSGPQDWGRKYLRSNGGCAYIDLGHLELCLPEVRSAYDHVAYTYAMMRVARQAQIDANEKLPRNQKIQVLANNSDGMGNSYGSHLNFLLTRRAWNNIFHRKIHYMLYLATYQVSSVVFAGQGKVGSENGRPAAQYQISSRADFFETLVGEQTTFRRPIVNARDEDLCGHRSFSARGRNRGGAMARLHVIFYDNTLCHVASLLKVGVMQIVLSMIECERINPVLILDDPLNALLTWSHDLTLRARAETVRGKELTAIEMQMLYFEEASRFVERGQCDGIVPRAREILAIWGDTLEKLKDAASAGGLAALAPLAPRLDWVLKLHILQRAVEQHPELTWDSPPLKHLDHIYSSVDPTEGLYWAYERSGFVERVATEAQIERSIHEPPQDTRAWTRAMLLRYAAPKAVTHVDWDQIQFKLEGESYWPRYRTLDLNDPLAFTKAEVENVFREEADLDRILNALEAAQTDSSAAATDTSDRPVGLVRSASESWDDHRMPRYPLVRSSHSNHAEEPEVERRENDTFESDGEQQ